MSNDRYFISTIGAGSLSMMSKPNTENGLQPQISALASIGVTKVVSLLTDEEAGEAGLGEEKQALESYGIGFDHYPITDYGVPTSLTGFCQFVKQQHHDIEMGQHSVIHCFAGIGRSGIVCASILMQSGYAPKDAFSFISEKRGKTVPDTQAQINWVIEHQKSICDLL